MMLTKKITAFVNYETVERREPGFTVFLKPLLVKWKGSNTCNQYNRVWILTDYLIACLWNGSLLHAYRQKLLATFLPFSTVWPFTSSLNCSFSTIIFVFQPNAQDMLLIIIGHLVVKRWSAHCFMPWCRRQD